MSDQLEMKSDDNKSSAEEYGSTRDASRRSSIQTLVPASNEVEAVLTRWWQDLLGIESVGLDDDFFDLGGHSLIGVQLFSRIKQTYGVDLGLSTLFDARTIRQLAELINQSSKATQSEPEPWSPVVPIQPNGSRPPLYIVPGGYGTTVLPFREVSMLLGPSQPVFGLEAPMPPPNEEMESIPDRAARFVKEMRAKQPNGPYYLLGWCGGGYVAFEMAQILSSAKQEVAFLGIIECADPQHPRAWWEGLLFRTQRAVWRVRNFTKRGPKGMAQWAGMRMGLISKRAEPAKLGNAVTPLPLELMDEVDERAWRNVYRYHPTSYPGKSVVIIGEESWKYSGVVRFLDPRLYWCILSTGGSEVKVIPGDHMDLLKAPNSGILASELKLHLGKAPTAE
ncbi:MAG: thioesterase domain-containing protein [Candidatus Acidiferrales bacterium]